MCVCVCVCEFRVLSPFCVPLIVYIDELAVYTDELSDLPRKVLITLVK